MIFLKFKNFQMKKLFFVFFAVFIFISNSNSQFIKSYGFQMGPSFYSQYWTNLGPVYSFSDYGAGFGFDFGTFAECSLYKRLTLVGGLHLSDKGTMAETPGLTFPGFGTESYFSPPVSNRFRDVSLQALVKYSFTKIDTGYYVIMGFRTDLMVQNYYTGNGNYTRLSNGRFEFGGTFGIGYEYRSGLFLEFQYNPNKTRTYNISNGNHFWDMKVFRSSIILTLGYNLRLSK